MPSPVLATCLKSTSFPRYLLRYLANHLLPLSPHCSPLHPLSLAFHFRGAWSATLFSTNRLCAVRPAKLELSRVKLASSRRYNLSKFTSPHNPHSSDTGGSTAHPNPCRPILPIHSAPDPASFVILDCVGDSGDGWAPDRNLTDCATFSPASKRKKSDICARLIDLP